MPSLHFGAKNLFSCSFLRRCLPPKLWGRFGRLGFQLKVNYRALLDAPALYCRHVALIWIIGDLSGAARRRRNIDVEILERERIGWLYYVGKLFNEYRTPSLVCLRDFIGEKQEKNTIPLDNIHPFTISLRNGCEHILRVHYS